MKPYSFILFAIMLLTSCSKTKDFYNELGRGSYLTLVNSNGLLNGKDPAANVTLTVNSVGSEPQSINVYVSSEPTTDTTQWILLKNVPYSGETTITVNNTEVADALGLSAGDLTPSSVFYFYNQVITKDGNRYSSANTSAGDLENQPAFNTALQWTATVVCPYDAATIAGTYTVVNDGWADWAAGDEVQVSAGPGENEIDLSQVWPNPAAGAIVTPLIIKVDPITGAITVDDNVIFGDYGGVKINTVAAGTSGFVFSCSNRIVLNLHINATPPFGDQGINQLILEK